MCARFSVRRPRRIRVAGRCAAAVPSTLCRLPAEACWRELQTPLAVPGVWPPERGQKAQAGDPARRAMRNDTIASSESWKPNDRPDVPARGALSVTLRTQRRETVRWLSTGGVAGLVPWSVSVGPDPPGVSVPGDALLGGEPPPLVGAV